MYAVRSAAGEVGVVAGDRPLGASRRDGLEHRVDDGLGMVIHQRIAAGFVALMTRPAAG